MEKKKFSFKAKTAMKAAGRSPQASEEMKQRFFTEKKLPRRKVIGPAPQSELKGHVLTSSAIFMEVSETQWRSLRLQPQGKALLIVHLRGESQAFLGKSQLHSIPLPSVRTPA